jgi:16S rRNA C1402 N4-methylase RsmH
MNVGIIILVAALGIWALSIFFGVIGGFSKSFLHSSPAYDSSSTKDREEQAIQDAKDKQQKFMEDVKQKMQDARQK